jgi:hypothetical protein
MLKNVSGQKVTLFAFDTTTGAPVTGDAANLTFYVTKDDGSVTALTDTSAAELSSTNAKGWYTCDLTAAETNATKLLFSGKSSTADIEVVGQLIYTTDLKWFGIINTGTLAAVTSTAIVDLASGASSNDDAYLGCFLQPTGGTGGDQNGSNVVDYVGADRRVTLSPVLDQTVSTDTTYYMFASPNGVDAAYAPTVKATDLSGNALATNTDMATVLTRLTSTRAGYLDNLSVAVASASDMATMLSRLSATRAGYLDNLSAALATATAVTNLHADVTTLLNRLTSTRAGYLDNLSGGAVALASGVSLSADSITSTALAASAVAEIAAGVMARTFEATKMAGYTFEELVGFMASVLLGKVSNLPTSPTFRNLGDTADAVVGATDTDGNRSAVTLTAASVR